jgi:alanine dehydrogenase
VQAATWKGIRQRFSTLNRGLIPFMSILIFNRKNVRELLPMAECMDVMADALAALARGEAIQPLRPVMWLPERTAALAVMHSYLDGPKAVGLKAITVFPGNHGTIYDSHQGVVLLFEAEHGRVQAIADASSITEIRTAAVSGTATRLLARESAAELAILGSGSQARAHLEAMLIARRIRRTRVWSRSPESARRFAEQESRARGIPVQAVDSVEEAVAGAEIICTTTASSEPVLKGKWLAEGAHINAVGACIASARELDSAAVVRSSLFVDRRESVLKESGDFLFPREEGSIDENHIRGEIGEVLTGQVPGRISLREITLFKSLGLAIEDLAAANHIFRKGLERGVGTPFDLDG